jgi:hypothetical protein
MAISENADKSIRVIDPVRCTECVGFYDRKMCQIECPVECCIQNPRKRETTQQLMVRAQSLYPDYKFTEPHPSDQESRDFGGENRQARRSA